MIQNAEILHGITDLDAGKYPNGEPWVKPKEPWNKPNKDFFRETLLLRPKSVASFMTAMFYVDALVERGYPIPRLIFPFALGARQDRLNTSGDFLFTAKSIAKEINMRNFPSVTVVDCHSEVMPALIDRCKNVHLADIVSRSTFAINGNSIYDGVISPDAGAEKRASAVAKVLGLPLYHGWKKRDVKTGELDGFGVETLPAWARDTINTNRSVPRFLIVDDICDGGGTFVGLAKYIKERVVQCDLDLLVTHGLFSQGVGVLKPYFNTVYTTDSIVRDDTYDRDIIKTINICASLIQGNL